MQSRRKGFLLVFVLVSMVFTVRAQDSDSDRERYLKQFGNGKFESQVEATPSADEEAQAMANQQMDISKIQGMLQVLKSGESGSGPSKEDLDEIQGFIKKSQGNGGQVQDDSENLNPLLLQKRLMEISKNLESRGGAGGDQAEALKSAMGMMGGGSESGEGVPTNMKDMLAKMSSGDMGEMINKILGPYRSRSEAQIADDFKSKFGANPILGGLFKAFPSIPLFMARLVRHPTAMGELAGIPARKDKFYGYLIFLGLTFLLSLYLWIKSLQSPAPNGLVGLFRRATRFFGMLILRLGAFFTVFHSETVSTLKIAIKTFGA